MRMDAMSTPFSTAPVSLAPAMLAPAISMFSRIAPERFASLRLARDILAPLSEQSVKSAA